MTIYRNSCLRAILDRPMCNYGNGWPYSHPSEKPEFPLDSTEFNCWHTTCFAHLLTQERSS
jgi:hypothetical protein